MSELTKLELISTIFQHNYFYTLLRQPLNTNTVVVFAQNVQILFIRFYWTN